MIGGRWAVGAGRGGCGSAVARFWDPTLGSGIASSKCPQRHVRSEWERRELSSSPWMTSDLPRDVGSGWDRATWDPDALEQISNGI